MAFPPIEDDPRLTAYALGELDDAERPEVEDRLSLDPEALRFVEDIRRTADLLTAEFRKESAATPAPATAPPGPLDPEFAVAGKVGAKPGSARTRPWRLLGLAASGLLAVGLTVVGLQMVRSTRQAQMASVAATRIQVDSAPASEMLAQRVPTPASSADFSDRYATPQPGQDEFFAFNKSAGAPAMPGLAPKDAMALAAEPLAAPASGPAQVPSAPMAGGMAGGYAGVSVSDGSVVTNLAGRGLSTMNRASEAGQAARGRGGVPTVFGGGSIGGPPPPGGQASVAGAPADAYGRSLALGKPPAAPTPGPAGPAAAARPRTYAELTQLRRADAASRGEPGKDARPALRAAEDFAESIKVEAEVRQKAKVGAAAGLVVAALEDKAEKKLAEAEVLFRKEAKALQDRDAPVAGEPLQDAQQDETRRQARRQDQFNREAYAAIHDNPFVRVTEEALSTFGIDVDTASYANVRRFLTSGQMPPPGAVRVEELVNYFAYDYAPPQDDRPFAVHTEFARAPWNADHRLVRIGLKGREVPLDQRPPSNLVFLVDVSGSMNQYNKLPWVQESLRMLTNELTENDRVAIVVYANSKGLALDSTNGDRKDLILGAIDRMQGGGSTNGGEGLRLAYDVAARNFVEGGINRILLCTDGDFNTGDVVGLDAVTRLAEEKRRTKVKLTVLGFGQGNLQDDQLEALANKGDGVYAYIDNLKEARRVLVEQMSGTLQTIAKDVKIQVEFNPRFVSAYRLIGYENRMLAAQDFKDDRKDAGDLGAGHTVTALYEIVPAGKEPAQAAPPADDLRFQSKARLKDDAASAAEALVVKLRYKAPDGDVSTQADYPATDGGLDYADASPDFKFAAAVAEFGMLLRGSPHKGNATYAAVSELAGASMGADPKGERTEFLDLVRLASGLDAPPP